MSAPAAWIAHLKCGHQAHLQGEPEPGHWITCVDGGCQGQRRIVRAERVREVPVPGEVGVQGTLWGSERAA